MWASSFKPHQYSSQQRRGFTIVELLIVVVVIAILAAITIVAYTGIQSRAKASAVQSSVETANKKVLSYAVINSDQYPPDLTTAGIVDGDTTYQYSVNNAVSPKTFCVTATNGTISYYVSSSNSTPTVGACAGHGAGGVATITNLVTNTTFALGTTGLSFSNSGSQASTNTTPSTGGPTNSSFVRRTYSAASTGFGNGSDVATMGGAFSGGVASAAPGQVFTLSAYVRSSRPQSVHAQIQWLTSGGTSSGTSNGSDVILSPNVWTRISVVGGVAPASTNSARVDLDGGAGAVQWAINDTMDYTMLMLTSGSTFYNFADGDSPNWVWNGTADASTSTGSPV